MSLCAVVAHVVTAEDILQTLHHAITTFSSGLTVFS